MKDLPDHKVLITIHVEEDTEDHGPIYSIREMRIMSDHEISATEIGEQAKRMALRLHQDQIDRKHKAKFGEVGE